ncbi:MAG TPA: DinB family protein [Dermatophilaceae bacterium]|nr:DinB family protein [Dermatophilaceae bacterium]
MTHTDSATDSSADPDLAVVPDDLPDPRPEIEPPLVGAEHTVLVGWLEVYRESVLRKIAGLTAEQLAQRSIPPSALSPIGLVRHLTEVERYWLTDVALGEDSPDLYSSREDPDGDFTQASAATAAADVAAYRTELETNRANLAALTDLDVPVAGLRRGQQVNLRWIYTHLIEEYARHLGHLDLLREAIDGRTGY